VKRSWKKNSEVPGEKTFPVVQRQPQIQHGLTRERTRVLAVNMQNKLRGRYINFYVVPSRERGPGSSVGIATD
jgi:hypothetical protein